MPLPIYTPCMRVNDGSAEDSLELISQYFKQGYSNLEILEFLKLHGVSISLSTLKRRFTSLGLSRRAIVSDDELRIAIEKELGCFVGYRKMWARIRKKGIIVKRARVMTLLRELDPDGVETRRKKRLRSQAYHTHGPNFIWHIDGHDKLKPFGFSVHGCIHGFSRRLIWLEVGPTYKSPEVIAKFYLDAVKQLSGVPRKIRSDDGIENSVIEALHTFLGSSHTDENASPRCFTIGRSPANQRIEFYWSQFVKDGPGWWIIFFKDLSDLGLFNSSDPVHQEFIRFCFIPILRNELNEVAEVWNQHLIASSKFGYSSGPRGRPDCMFFLPHLYNSENYKVPVDPQELEEFIDESTMCPADCSQEFEEFAETIMNALGLQPPQGVIERLDAYVAIMKEVGKLS